MARLGGRPVTSTPPTAWTSFHIGQPSTTPRSPRRCAAPSRARGMDSRVDRLRALGREHGPALALTAIVAVAAIVRFATLGDQSLDHDETVTAARVLHPSFLQSMQVVVNGERSPPLYYVLIWGWSRLWGTGAVDLRSLSAIFGTLTVVAAYLAGRELVSRRAALIPA